MTRVGLGYVAMAAAGITVAVLGYAVIWAYGEPDAPRVVVSASAPPERPALATATQPAQDKPTISAPAAVRETTPPAEVDRPQADSTQDDVSAKAQSVPERPAQIADAIPPSHRSRTEKPGAVSAPKDARTPDRPTLPNGVARPEASAAAVSPNPPQPAHSSAALATPQSAKPERPAAPASSEKPTAPLTALAAPPRHQESAALAPSSIQAPKPVESQAAAAVPKTLAAERAMPAAGSGSASSASVSLLAATEAASEKPAAATSEKPALLSAPTERAQFQSPSTETLPVAPLSPPPNGVSAASPRQPEPPESLTPPNPPQRSARPRRRVAALPPQAVTDAPSVTIMRGSRRPAVTHHPRAAEKKVAALPSGAEAARTATDAPPILVLRGVRRAYDAPASAPRPAAEPLLTIIRGARPRPVLLQHYVQPNALILHIHR